MGDTGRSRACVLLVLKFSFVEQSCCTRRASNMSLFISLFVVAALVTGIEPTRTTRRVNVLYSAETVGHTGDWGNLDVCPPGQYVVGFSLKSEVNKGLGDDTALNGIRLRCNGGGSVSSTVHKWGHWTAEQRCHGGAVDGFQIQIEPNMGLIGDDSAANNVNLMCKVGGHHRILHGRSLTHWGKWSHWLKCRNGQVAVGMQPRVQEAKGFLKDDSALNGMKLLCAPAPGNYYQVTSGHCTSVTEPECEALAHHRNVEFHDIRNPHLNLYPRGCYYNKDKNLFYFNPAASTHLCTSKRICICKKHVPTVTLTCHAKNSGEDCWYKCGKKGGRCDVCGPLGYCCRNGWSDCPAKMAALVHGSHHSCVSCKRKAAKKFTCHHWTSADLKTMGRNPSVATEKNHCENNLGFKFSHGDNKKAPGCGTCWCCKPNYEPVNHLRCRGINDGCCTAEKPCGLGDGDCDRDSQCGPGLVCGNSNCPWGDGDDCCEVPKKKKWGGWFFGKKDETEPQKDETEPQKDETEPQKDEIEPQKDEIEPQKDEKEDTNVNSEEITTADVPKEDVKEDQPAQDAEVDNSEQEMKSEIKDETSDESETDGFVDDGETEKEVLDENDAEEEIVEEEVT